MPTYEYRCSGCGEVFSVVQGMRDAPLQTHEGCGGPVERLISGGRFLMTDRKSGPSADLEEDFSGGASEDLDGFDEGAGDFNEPVDEDY